MDTVNGVSVGESNIRRRSRAVMAPPVPAPSYEKQLV